MLGVRFLDVDFMRINFACGLQTVYLIRLFCTVVKEERLHGAHRDRNAGWRHRSGRAAWRRGPRGQPHFVLPPNLYNRTPGRGGTFWFQIFIQASSPEIWSETISGGEEVLAGKWGGLFLGYLLGKNFRRRDRDHPVPGGWAAVCRAEVCYPFGREHGRHRAVRRREFNNVARRRGCRVAARGARA